MDMAVAFDLETVPQEAAMALPYPEASRHPPSNYKADEAIAKWRAQDRLDFNTQRVKQYSLSPQRGRIVAVGLADADGAWSHIARTEADEARLLDKVWTRLSGSAPVVTWNGLHFDVPYLITRSMLLGVTLPVGIDASDYLRRYSAYPHCDVKAVLHGYDSQRMRQDGNSLDDWAVTCGLSPKVSHGSEVFAMHTAGRHAEIGAYAADDAAKTLSLYHRMAPYFLGQRVD